MLQLQSFLVMLVLGFSMVVNHRTIVVVLARQDFTSLTITVPMFARHGRRKVVLLVNTIPQALQQATQHAHRVVIMNIPVVETLRVVQLTRLVLVRQVSVSQLEHPQPILRVARVMREPFSQMQIAPQRLVVPVHQESTPMLVPPAVPVVHVRCWILLLRSKQYTGWSVYAMRCRNLSPTQTAAQPLVHLSIRRILQCWCHKLLGPRAMLDPTSQEQAVYRMECVRNAMQEPFSPTQTAAQRLVLACPSGEYSNAGATSCTPWTLCPAGERFTTGTSTSDSSCSPCDAGTFQPNSDSTATSCSACVDGYSAAGASSCTPWTDANCDAGFELVTSSGSAAIPTEDASCSACSSGKWQPLDATLNLCQPHTDLGCDASTEVGNGTAYADNTACVCKGGHRFNSYQGLVATDTTSVEIASSTQTMSVKDVQYFSDGGYAVVWHQLVTGYTTPFIQFYNADGTRRYENSPRSVYAASSAAISRVIVFSDDTVHLLTSRYDNTVYVQKFNDDGTKDGSVTNFQTNAFRFLLQNTQLTSMCLCTLIYIAATLIMFERSPLTKHWVRTIINMFSIHRQQRLMCRCFRTEITLFCLITRSGTVLVGTGLN